MIPYNQYGFEYKGTCSCDGVNTEKYQNGIWMLKHRPKTGLFKFKQHSQTVTGWMDETRAIDYIKQHIYVAVHP